jgi:transaldolase
MKSRTHIITQAGQSLWLDNIQRRELTDGTLKRMIDEDGISGITSNPSIFMNAVSKSNDYDSQIQQLLTEGKSTAEIYEAITVEDITAAGQLMLPIFEASGHADGFVSIELNPRHAFKIEESIAEAQHLMELIALPNIMVKVPGTTEGIRVAQSLLEQGINVNITLLFDPECYRLVAQAYITALEKRLERKQDIQNIHSVASFFISRLDTQVDPQLDTIIAQPGEPAQQATALRGRAAESIARVTFALSQELFNSERFQKLADNGARQQRLLWASTGTKDPAYSDVKYVEGLIAPGTVNTLPPKTIAAFRDHGQSGSIQNNFAEAPEALRAISSLGIDLQTIYDELLAAGVASFEKAYLDLLETISAKSAALSGRA